MESSVTEKAEVYREIMLGSLRLCSVKSHISTLKNKILSQ